MRFLRQKLVPVEFLIGVASPAGTYNRGDRVAVPASFAEAEISAGRAKRTTEPLGNVEHPIEERACPSCGSMNSEYALICGVCRMRFV